jgi:hypothetical protein
MPDQYTSIGDVFVPEISTPAVAQRSKLGSSLITSPIVLRSPAYDAFASGAGSTVKLDSFGPSRTRSEIQKESTAPAVNKIGTYQQIAPMLERVLTHGSTALARSRGSQDPVGFISSMVADDRNYDRQCILLAILAGLFGTTAAGAFAPLRNDHFDESGDGATSDQLIDSDLIIDAAAGLGELKGLLENGGCMACHTDIEAALNKQDKIQMVYDSQGKLVMKVYKGMRLFTSNLLVRSGATNGKVYTTYLMAPGTVATGDKAQSNQIGDTASLVMDGDAAKNNLTLYDRTRFILHPNGAKWIGTPAGESASDVELSTESNWALGIKDVEAVGMVQIRTNG